MTGLALVDLRLAMARLEAAEGPIRQDVSTSAGWLVRVVRLEGPEATRFEHLATLPTLVMVLSGVGTLVVEDWRLTVLPGQLVPVLGGQRLAFVADGGGALVGALLQMEAVDVAGDGVSDEGVVDVT